jgi:hypothetical protein
MSEFIIHIDKKPIVIKGQQIFGKGRQGVDNSPSVVYNHMGGGGGNECDQQKWRGGSTKFKSKNHHSPPPPVSKL